jgi:sugar-specific transcriptional regulator TrmB
MNLMESLINLGLNEKEAKIYLALLQFEKATAYTIATRSGLKKPTAYVILNNLVAKGFALKIPYKENHYFIAKSPKECLALAKEKLYTVEEALPELMAMRKKSDEKASVSYYEGLDGIKEMNRKIISVMKAKPVAERNFVAFYAHQKDTPSFLQKYWIELIEEFDREKIKRRFITTKHPSIAWYLKKEMIRQAGLEVKALSEKDYSSNISIEIYDNFVQIVSHRYIQGILIENPDIADVTRQIFNLVWKLTKEEVIK